MKKIIAVLIFTLIFSCKKEEKIATTENTAPTETKVEVKSNTTTLKGLELETFGFPQDIEGCSCYFATDRENFVKQNYIYVDDYQKNAYIKVNGKQIKLKYDKQNNVQPQKGLNIKLHNSDYKVTLTGKMVEEGEIETALYKGTMVVETKDGKKTQIPVYGECGC